MPTQENISIKKKAMSDSFKSIIAGIVGKSTEVPKEALEKHLGERFHAVKGRAYNVVSAKRDWSWDVDAMFFPLRGKPRAIFAALEMTSRKAFARPYSGSSPTGEETVAFLEELRKENTVNVIQADPGSEFKNRAVTKWAKKHEVELYFTQPGVKLEQTLIERFNKSLRSLLTQYVEAIKKAGGGWGNWVPILNDILTEYNQRKNKATDMAPNEIGSDRMARIRVVMEASGDKYVKLLDRYKPGTLVRIAEDVDPRKSSGELENANEFRKGGVPWTREVFKVVRQEGYKLIVSLKGKEFKRRLSPRDLQIVESEGSDMEDSDEEERENAKVERRKRSLHRAGLHEAAKGQVALLRGKRAAPKKVATKEEGKVLPPEEYHTLPLSKRKDIAVSKIVGWDVDDEDEVAVFYIKYQGEGEKVFAVNASEFYVQNKAVYLKYKDTIGKAKAWEESWKWEKMAERFITTTNDDEGDPIIDQIGQFVKTPPLPDKEK